MLKYQRLAIAAGLALALTACDQAAKQAETTEAPAESAAEPSLDLSSDNQKVSYGLGRTSAIQMLQGGIRVDAAAYKAGFDDAVAGKEPRIDEVTFNAAREVVLKEMQERRQQEMDAMAEKNKSESATFFAENGKKEGVVTTASGLQYKVVVAGEGPIPALADTVKVHYRGTFLDGNEFDSSYRRGQPVTFPVGGVIPGWTEALQLMPVGSKWELYIPSDLAYGPGGTGNIPPNATLVFEVELLGIEGAGNGGETPAE